MRFLLALAAVLAACSSEKAPEAPPPPAPAPAAAPAAAGDPLAARTFDFVVKNLRGAATGAGAMAFSSQTETGGNPITYLASCMADDVSYAPIAWEKATKPRSVVVKPGPGANDYTIEEYMDDLATPLRSEVVTIPPAGR